MNFERKPRSDGVGRPGGGARILQFRRPRSPARAERAPIADPIRQLDKDEDRLRMRQNLAAAAVILFVVMSGYWLIDNLRAGARIAACVEAGHRNCMPLDLEQAQRR
jgi:hypothetical protein